MSLNEASVPECDVSDSGSLSPLPDVVESQGTNETGSQDQVRVSQNDVGSDAVNVSNASSYPTVLALGNGCSGQWAAFDILQQELMHTRQEASAHKAANLRSRAQLRQACAALLAVHRCAVAHTTALGDISSTEDWNGDELLAPVRARDRNVGRLAAAMKQVADQENFVCGIGVALQEVTVRLPEGRGALGPPVRAVQVLRFCKALTGSW